MMKKRKMVVLFRLKTRFAFLVGLSALFFKDPADLVFEKESCSGSGFCFVRTVMNFGPLGPVHWAQGWTFLSFIHSSHAWEACMFRLDCATYSVDDSWRLESFCRASSFSVVDLYMGLIADSLTNMVKLHVGPLHMGLFKWSFTPGLVIQSVMQSWCCDSLNHAVFVSMLLNIFSPLGPVHWAHGWAFHPVIQVHFWVACCPVWIGPCTWISHSWKGESFCLAVCFSWGPTVVTYGWLTHSHVLSCMVVPCTWELLWVQYLGLKFLHTSSFIGVSSWILCGINEGSSTESTDA